MTINNSKVKFQRIESRNTQDTSVAKIFNKNQNSKQDSYKGDSEPKVSIIQSPHSHIEF
jgi:hypothetical protein